MHEATMNLPDGAEGRNCPARAGRHGLALLAPAILTWIASARTTITPDP